MKKNVPSIQEIGERIRELRMDMKMTQETFAELIDISNVFLWLSLSTFDNILFLSISLLLVI